MLRTIRMPPHICALMLQFLLFCISTRENTGHVIQNVSCADITIAIGLDQPAFYDVELFLSFFIHDVRYEACQLDGILAVLEELQLERLEQSFVRGVIELPSFDSKRADVVHDFPAEVIFPAVR